MTTKQAFTYECDACHQYVEDEFYSSVNATVNPELKVQVQEGDIFMHTCPHCHQKHLLPTPFLYHDMNRNFMILLNNDASEFQAAIDRDDLPMQGLKLRKVDAYNELLEKIDIFDQGLDDRTVELIKALLLLQARREQKPGMWPIHNIQLISEKEQCRRGMEKSDKLLFAIDTDQEELPIIQIEQAYYDQMNAKMVDIPEDRENGLKIDIQWAMNFMMAHPQG